MKQETITITKEEYERLKKLEELDFDLIRQFAGSLEDLKKGRFKRLA
jgi:predicted CopG family antitoxin